MILTLFFLALHVWFFAPCLCFAKLTSLELTFSLPAAFLIVNDLANHIFIFTHVQASEPHQALAYLLGIPPRLVSTCVGSYCRVYFGYQRLKRVREKEIWGDVD
jgi:hypothetical protein